LIGEGLGLGEIGLGLGMGIGEEDNRGREGEQEVRDREWRETVRNLLLVVDGMVSTPSLFSCRGGEVRLADFKRERVSVFSHNN